MLAVSSGPRWAFADGTFLVFLRISAINGLFAPGRGRCGGLRFLSQSAQKLSTPRVGAGALKVKPPDSGGRALP